MHIVSRDQWGARAPVSGIWVKTPVSKLYVHHSVTVPGASPYADMRRIDDIGRERFGRFSYSYAIHPFGTVMEGAGERVGAHTANQNSTSLGIVFIGNYETDKLTPEAIRAFRELRQELVVRGAVKPVHQVAPHRAVKSTACPGADVMRHWDDLLQPAGPPQAPPPKEEDDLPYSTEQLNLIVQDAVRDAISVAMGKPGVAVPALRKRIYDELADQAEDPNSPLRRAIRAEK